MLMHSKPRPIVDVDECVIAVLGGKPRDPGWDGVSDRASQAMEEARQQCERANSLKVEQRSHRRGEFLAGAIGASYGGGRKVRMAPLTTRNL